jgi:prevent-host-death family protein
MVTRLSIKGHIVDIRVTSFAVAEAKARFSELLDRAEKGEQLTITRHGKEIARLGPVVDEEAIARRREAVEGWIKYRDASNITLGPDLTIKQLINEGRRF